MNAKAEFVNQHILFIHKHYIYYIFTHNYHIYTTYNMGHLSTSTDYGLPIMKNEGGAYNDYWQILLDWQTPEFAQHAVEGPHGSNRFAHWFVGGRVGGSVGGDVGGRGPPTILMSTQVA